MKTFRKLIVTIIIFSASAFAQRDYLVHDRGMLHQTEYNTGEIGRGYDNGGSGSLPNVPSFEWPANSSVFLTRQYNGQYNSFGAGLYLSATVGSTTTRIGAQCGAVSDINGNPLAVLNVYSFPVSLQKIENYPVLSNGNLNPAYNPNEAEQTIIAKWHTNTGITVTRTSHSWSFPDYDDFIIYEYELENTGEYFQGVAGTPAVIDTLKDIIVAWGYSLAPSMFGYERRFNQWAESDYRTRDMFARYDTKRYMTYNHDRNGKPDPSFFANWASAGKYGGGLNSPQAVGILPLYYDYAHIVDSGKTSAFIDPSDRAILWDANRKMKQPYINRYENGNLYPSKIIDGNTAFINAPRLRKTRPFNGSNDSLYFGTYWIGRAKPSWTLETDQPVSHIYGFGPYNLPPREKLRFVIAEVAGFGAGVAGDSIYSDLGGGNGRSSGENEPTPGIHPVSSWYKKMKYDYLNTINGTQDADGSYSIGSDYLQTYPLPPYVNSNVISIRDAADRAIQMYKGGPVIKYDSIQYEPLNSPPTGVYQVSIPFPAPVFSITNTIAAVNEITWGTQVEAFTSPRLNAGLRYYEVLRQDHPLSKAVRVDSVGVRDPRYYNIKGNSLYIVRDVNSNINEAYYYSVVSVDSLGGRSGMTNLTFHSTQAPAANPMGKVYAVPNPLVVTGGIGGGVSQTSGGNINDKIGFYGLPNHATIRIFSYSGQLIATLEHDVDSYTVEWFQVTRNNQRLASGVYYFTVDEKNTGKRSWNKFIIIH